MCTCTELKPATMPAHMHGYCISGFLYKYPVRYPVNREVSAYEHTRCIVEKPQCSRNPLMLNNSNNNAQAIVL